MDKMPSPWSEEFYTGNTTARVVSDEIQHVGNKNSGRYKRGSGKNPRSTGGQPQSSMGQDNRDKRFVKNATRIGTIGRSRSIDTPQIEKGTGRMIYPKSWKPDQIKKHMIDTDEKEYQRRQKVHAEFIKKHNIPIEDALGPASKKEIRDAEKELGVTFSDEYKSILSYHGILSIRSGSSHDMIGIVPGKPESNYNTVKATKWERDNDPKAPKDAYVVENTGYDGLTIWQKTNGTVYQRFPNEPLRKAAGSLTEWLNT